MRIAACMLGVYCGIACWLGGTGCCDEHQAEACAAAMSCGWLVPTVYCADSAVPDLGRPTSGAPALCIAGGARSCCAVEGCWRDGAPCSAPAAKAFEMM